MVARTQQPKREHKQRWWRFDSVLGLLVWGTVSWMITADQAGERAPDLVAYFWAVGLGALMLVRRQYPNLVLWITVLSLFAYYMAAYPAVGLSVPTAGALMTGAEFLKLRWPVVASLLLIGVSSSVRLIQGQDFSRIIGYELAGHVGLMAAAIALGTSLRFRHQLQRQSVELVAAVKNAERSHKRAAVATERTKIARELHDALGHRTTVISMHADVARESLEHSPDATRDALEVIKSTTTDMMAELRQTVRTLREEQHDAPTALQASASIHAIEGMFSALPIQVSASIDAPEQLPAAVEAAVYSIVQEALTNVAKHSAAATAVVEVNLRIHEHRPYVILEVSDPGPRKHCDSTTPGGSGIRGMQERAVSLGGNLAAEPYDEGFRVFAHIPVEKVA
ncbi:MAG: sensor histidine kinase [Nesterenkonia sp.]